MRNLIKLFFFLIHIVSIYCITKEEAIQQNNECLKEFKITKVELKTWRENDSAELGCFIACLMKKRGSLEDGKVNPTIILKTIRQLEISKDDWTEEKITNCAAKANEEDDECVVAKNMKNCLYSEITKE